MPFVAPKISGASEFSPPVSTHIIEVIVLSYNYCHIVDCFNG